MSEISRSSGGNPGGESDRYDPRPRGLTALILLVLLEAAAMATVVAWLLFELVTDTPRSIASALALVLLAAVTVVFLAAIARGAIRRQPWVRAAAMTWQIVQLAVAAGAFQGEAARPDIGWAIALPSVLVIGLLLSPGVTRALQRD